MQLITYVDRLAGNMRGLRKLLGNEFGGLFKGVHLLPFFSPIDGADAGFDPVDHTTVDSRLGDWHDVKALSANCSLTADVIVNHISVNSPQFLDVRKRGKASKYWDLFLRKDDVFPDEGPTDSAEHESRLIYRPRPGQPFTTIELDDGSSYEFWTTFSDSQLDINVETSAGRAYLDNILTTLADAGVRELRLDAAGYAIKRRGTSCFMLPETYDFLGQLSDRASELGMQTLVEIHSYYKTQIEIAQRVGRVYDFALPPLVLHTLYSGSSDALTNWLSIAPKNCVTVLDTHDGIGIVDVGRNGSEAGLLTDVEIEELVESIHTKSGGASRLASGHAASNLDVYQVNSTFYDALGRNDPDYLIARAIQFFAPGTPQIYYMGLLAGENDLEQMKKTGVGRDINRSYYSRRDIHDAMRRPVVRRLMQLVLLRNQLTAFEGTMSIPNSPEGELRLRWDSEKAWAQLTVELKNHRATIDYVENEMTKHLVIDQTWVDETDSHQNEPWNRVHEQ
ncbi:MAG: sucrose phosphorylase [Gammaproteobacteria bacterium]